MISLATPWIFGIAVAAAFATAALHLLSVRRPPSMMLPTMRFLPDRSVRAVSRTTRPSDLALLALRVSALLLAGLALAGLSWHPKANVRGRVVIVDRGRTVGDVAAWRSVVARQLGAQTAGAINAFESRVILADSASVLLDARATSALSTDTLKVVPVQTVLAGAMLTALRAAEDISRENPRVDSVELVVVSPLARESTDEAVQPLRAQWPGRVSIESVGAASVAASSIVRANVLGATSDDAVAAAIGALVGTPLRGTTAARDGNTPSVRTIEIDRDSVAREQSAASGAGTIRVVWPINGVPANWTRAPTDTIGAIVLNDNAVIAPFIRAASPRTTTSGSSRPIAWWSDGRAAVIERAVGESCERTVGVLVPARGDALLGQSAQPLLSALLAPCGGTRDTTSLADSWREQFSATGSLASIGAFNRAGRARSLLAPWLLAGALALLGFEWWWRERTA